MNRRSFITKALAGLAAVPLLGKLAQAAPAQTGKTVTEWADSSGYWPTEMKAFAVYDAARMSPLRTVTITFTHDGFHRAFPLPAPFLCPVDAAGIATLHSEQGEHRLKLRSYTLREYDVEVEAVVIECCDASACRLGCVGQFYADIYSTVDIQTTRWPAATS